MKTMHDDVISTKIIISCWKYFNENSKKEEDLSNLCREKVMPVFYWLCQGEVAHGKVNFLLELAEFLGIEEVVYFKKRSSKV